MVVAVFSSDAPIAASGGHSQSWDPLAGEMAAFLARLRAAAGENPAFERRLAGLSPSTVYVAFICDAMARHITRQGEVIDEGRKMDVLRRERSRLLNDLPSEWAAGQALAANFAEVAAD